MTPEQYISLYEKYLSGYCTAEEEELLIQYQDNFKMQDVPAGKLADSDKLIRRNIYQRIDRSLSDNRSGKVIKLFWWWSAAAVLLLTAALGVWLLNKRPEEKLSAKNDINKHDVIKPGANAAVLTLANGASIMLDNTANGVIARSGNTAIKKVKNGLLSYAGTEAGAGSNTNALNTITIPKGGQYTITLPDGTNVWLNSESSLTFPTAFNGVVRSVTLKGEAYFEVTKNKQKPFVVHADNTDVNVLGTHFNVKAYREDGNIKTTLLEGSVRLSSAASSALLVPGEQGITDVSNGRISQKKVNINQVMAWKAGYFVFRADDIHDIMKQIGRWYDVEVEYQGNMSNKTFGGTYSKNKDINELLKGLEYTGLVHFKIEGRRIIVMP